jgi:hypothetical protein
MSCTPLAARAYTGRRHVELELMLGDEAEVVVERDEGSNVGIEGGCGMNGVVGREPTRHELRNPFSDLADLDGKPIESRQELVPSRLESTLQSFGPLTRATVVPHVTRSAAGVRSRIAIRYAASQSSGSKRRLKMTVEWAPAIAVR